jgi:glycosyltransferase involved in cell wall biosynthesis
MSDDFISIIMPSKNVEKYIKQCIESVLVQTHKNYEFIIIDDSEDSTSNIINAYNDIRIKHIKFKGNISQALNYGIRIANSNYICRMDSDDIMMPERIEKQYRFLKDNSEIDLLGTNFFCINENGSIIFEKRFPEKHKDIEFMMPIVTSILHPTIMIKKESMMKYGGYNENLIYAEDLEFFLRTINFAKFHNLQESLHYYRIINKSKTIKERNNSMAFSLCVNYLNNKKKDGSDCESIAFQKGLLEYYRNDVREARRLLVSVLFSKNLNCMKTLRYLIPSLLGNRWLKYLRKIGLLNKLNIYLINIFHWDSNNIK